MFAAGAAITRARRPHELVGIGDRTGLDDAALVRTSRLVAEVDSVGVQAGFGLYLNGFIVTADGFGRGPARHERRAPPGPTLPLAF
jgi:hypothetical protein